MNIIEWTQQLRFLVALALGFLIGLERESIKVEHKFLYLGGVRTYPIVSMMGFGCAWLYQSGATFLLPVMLLALSGLTIVAYNAKVHAGRTGATSEIALLLTYVIGALALLVDVWIAMALGIVSTVLLSEKAELETWVERMDRVGFLATLRFLLVTLIILPALPDQEYTRFKINPSRVWQIVIIVSTVGYVGYLLSKRIGKRAGLWISGVLGGIASSTATTISIGRIAQNSPARTADALEAVLLSSSAMYVRLLVLVWVINTNALSALWWKLLVLGGIGVALAVSVKRPAPEKQQFEPPEVQNPFEIRPALIFAAMFVGLTILTTLVVDSLGDAGTRLLALIVGVTDIDPFILSIIHNPSVIIALASSAVLIAAMSNTVAKGVYFGMLARGMRKETAWRYALWAVLHVPLVFI